ncbi:MAG: hypothetical protein WC707_01210 [Candidatus Babeliaceae bacterium]|jgi:hypothetical protein
MDIIDPLNGNRLNGIFKTADMKGLNTFLGEPAAKKITSDRLKTKFKNTKPWWYFDTLGATGENQMNFIDVYAKWGSLGLMGALLVRVSITKPTSPSVENGVIGITCLLATTWLLTWPAIPILEKMQKMHGKRSKISERIKTHHSA